MYPQEKVFENRVRRVAKRQGYRLVKSRRRDPRAVDYKTYALKDKDGKSLFEGYDIDRIFDLLVHPDADPSDQEIKAIVRRGRQRGWLEEEQNQTDRLAYADKAGWKAIPPGGGEPVTLSDAIRLIEETPPASAVRA